MSRAAVIAALRRIDSEGVPANRRSIKYSLMYDGKAYPPKYVLSLAVEQSTGVPLDPAVFSGGDQTNGILGKLGFDIGQKPAG